jgi:hypothetical protein
VISEYQDSGTAIEIVGRKHRWDAPAKAAHRAISVHFAIARVHHSQVTLAVYNLTRY